MEKGTTQVMYSMLRLEDLGVLMILEEKNHFFNNFLSNEMVWTS
jgi:hypothetical protein